MKFTFDWPRGKSTQTLDRVVADHLTSALGHPVARGHARSACEAGQVRVNGRQAPPALRRPSGTARVEVTWLDQPTPQFTFAPDWILSETGGLLALNKPCGLLTHATADRSRQNLVDLLREHRPDLCELTLHHRLDKDTSGLVLFSSSRETRVCLAQQFEARLVRKEYLCWVQGKRLQARWTEEAPLRERSGRVSVGPGQSAITEFELLQRVGGHCLVLARPLTGRKHQIRAHLAHRGLPIVGDPLFGGQNHSRLLLHAYRLQVNLPSSVGPLQLEADPGKSFRLENC